MNKTQRSGSVCVWTYRLVVVWFWPLWPLHHHQKQSFSSCRCVKLPFSSARFRCLTSVWQCLFLSFWLISPGFRPQFTVFLFCPGAAPAAAVLCLTLIVALVTFRAHNAASCLICQRLRTWCDEDKTLNFSCAFEGRWGFLLINLP